MSRKNKRKHQKPQWNIGNWLKKFQDDDITFPCPQSLYEKETDNGKKG